MDFCPNQAFLSLELGKNQATKPTRPKRGRSRLFLIDACPACGFLAVELATCREGRLLQCRECPAAFAPYPNEYDAKLRSIAWVLPDPTQVAAATTAGLVARVRGEYKDVSGLAVAIVRRHADDDAFQSVFEAKAASDAGAIEVRTVTSIGFDQSMPGRLLLEWLDAPVYEAVAAEKAVAE